MIRLIFAFVLASAMSACSTYRVSAENVQLMPAPAARAILEKWYGKDWVNSPEVQGGSGLVGADDCKSSTRRVTYSEFVDAVHFTSAAETFLVISLAGRWTKLCVHSKLVRGLSLEEAKQVVTAINSLGGRIEEFSIR